MCIETQPDRSAESQVPRDLKPWAATMKTLAAEHRGFIDAYEILNEPNIWSGLRKNPDPAKFRDVTPEVNAECIRVLGKAIHEGDPNTKLAKILTSFLNTATATCRNSPIMSRN